MLTYIANRQSSINSKTKQNEVIPNNDEHNKTNSVFFRICLVLHASSVLFDDGEVHCRVYDLWLSQICKQTFGKLSLESELDLLKYSNIDILTLILMQNKLKHTSHCCTHLMLQKQENWQKAW